MRDHISSVASDLFYRHGTGAVGIDRVIAEANVAKSTLYRHFSSKEALIASCLEQRSNQAIVRLSALLAAAPPEPAARVTILFDDLHRRAVDGTFRGCPFVMAVTENAQSEPIRIVSARHKGRVKALIREGVFADWLAVGEDEIGAAVVKIAICHDGAMATLSVQRDPAFAQMAKAMALSVIDGISGIERCK